MRSSIDREIERFNAALCRLRVSECANYRNDSEWRDPSVLVTHIDARLCSFLERILGPANRIIEGLRWHPWGSHYLHYGNLLSLREAICVLQERYGGCGLLDLYENEDLCDAGLVPFFTGPNGWLYCIRNTYLDDADKKILVIADGDHSVRGVEEDGRIFSAGIVPMSMAEMIIRFADHAELQMKDPHGTSDGLDDETPPESLIEWP